MSATQSPPRKPEAHANVARSFWVHAPAVQISKVQMMAAAILLLALAARWIPGPRTIDDSFITFRYARNILAGNGFTYNPGEQVLGTTTPLYTFLLVGAGALTGGAEAPFPVIAQFLNSLFDAFTCLLLVWLGRRLGASRAGLGAALVWAIAPYSVTFAIGGLETSLCVFLLTAAVSAHLAPRRILAALAAALLLLTRPDTLILLGPLALDRLLQAFPIRKIASKTSPTTQGVSSSSSPTPPLPHSPSLLQESAAFLLPLLPWLIFSFSYFGSPLPHSIAAKTLAYRLSPESAFVRLLQHYATPFQEHLTFGTLWIGVGLVLYPFLSIIGARRILRHEPHAWPLIAYPWLYFAVFALANPLIFRWYLTPPLPFYIFTLLAGADQLIADLFKKKEPAAGDVSPAASPYARVVAVVFVLLAPFALSLREWNLAPTHGLTRPAPDMAWYQLELLYRQAADELAPHMQARPQPTVLAAGDVGVLGYFTPARILDTVGLNSPESLSYYPLDPAYYTINYAIPARLILDQKPDYIVILEVYARKTFLRDPLFRDAYSLRRKIPTDIYGSDGMLIFEKKDGG